MSRLAVFGLLCLLCFVCVCLAIVGFGFLRFDLLVLYFALFGFCFGGLGALFGLVVVWCFMLLLIICAG